MLCLVQGAASPSVLLKAEILHGLSGKRKGKLLLWLCFIFLSQKVALKAACTADLWTPFSCNSAVTFSPSQVTKKRKKKPKAKQKGYKQIFSFFCLQRMWFFFFPSQDMFLLYRLQIWWNQNKWSEPWQQKAVGWAPERYSLKPVCSNEQ